MYISAISKRQKNHFIFALPAASAVCGLRDVSRVQHSTRLTSRLTSYCLPQLPRSAMMSPCTVFCCRVPECSPPGPHSVHGAGSGREPSWLLPCVASSVQVETKRERKPHIGAITPLLLKDSKIFCGMRLVR